VRTAFVLKGYPRLSETFIAQEILALEQRGVSIAIFSLRLPTDKLTHDLHAQIRAPVAYLPEYVYQEPLRVLRGWWASRRLPGYRRARQIWWRDFRRDPSSNRMRRFAQAMVLARELDAAFTHLHGHFLHTPGSVTRYTALMRGLSWSFSAHAKDIWTTPKWELREKLGDCAWGVCCTAAGTDYLNGLAGKREAPVALCYHGIDLARFPLPPERGEMGNTGTDPASPVRLVSVGRAVVKKGYDILLRALALLPPDIHWRLEHLGGGPELTSLQALAAELGLTGRIGWRGPADQKSVLKALRESDLFALACRIAPDGDRDGIPNVLMEAQSQALACVTTSLPAVSEFIRHGETGLLCPPEDHQAFAAALELMMRNPEQRAAMGRQGRMRLEGSFQLRHSIDRLVSRLQGS